MKKNKNFGRTNLNVQDTFDDLELDDFEQLILELDKTNKSEPNEKEKS